MFCEFYYLLAWALFGWWLARFASDGASVLPALFDVLPRIALVAAVAVCRAFVFHAPQKIRTREVARTRRAARVSPRTPHALLEARRAALTGAARRRLGVRASSRALWRQRAAARNAGALAHHFFGTLIPGPFRAAAISLWTLLMPEARRRARRRFWFCAAQLFRAVQRRQSACCSYAAPTAPYSKLQRANKTPARTQRRPAVTPTTMRSATTRD